ncbi:hypothetical protein V3G39_09485 [Dermatophilaceae bacterium Sec6.4]
MDTNIPSQTGELLARVEVGDELVCGVVGLDSLPSISVALSLLRLMLIVDRPSRLILAGLSISPLLSLMEPNELARFKVLSNAGRLTIETTPVEDMSQKYIDSLMLRLRSDSRC